MPPRRRIEFFSAGCPCCDRAIAEVLSVVPVSGDVLVLDMHEPDVAARARHLGVSRVPAVVIDGELLECCDNGRIDAQALIEAGVAG